MTRDCKDTFICEERLGNSLTDGKGSAFPIHEKKGGENKTGGSEVGVICVIDVRNTKLSTVC